MTVFVGPNNSGKSQVLREINHYCVSGNPQHGDVILDSLAFEQPTPERASELGAMVTLAPRENEVVSPDHIFVGRHQTRHQVSEHHFNQALRDPNAYSPHFCQWYLSMHTLMLDGNSRINLVNEQSAVDLQRPSGGVLDILFRDNQKRAEVRRIGFEAFGRYFVVDPTNLGKLRIRYADEEPGSELEERGIHDAAVGFHRRATLISDCSDGVKAFTGIVTQIIAGDPKVISIDEPEAFLHPALSFKLGKEVAKSAALAGKRLFVSTHSASFVMGCIQSGSSTNIVRLTYNDGVPTARLLRNSKLLRLMRNPLLRSTGVLEGLFYESVIVTESDTDRAFYQEVNDRLLRQEPSRGVSNCLFLNAQNKQTIHHIVRPLRELGIPAAGVVDIDILKEGGATWTNFLGCGFVPAVSHVGLGQVRAAIKKKCDDSGRNMKRDGGVRVLESSDQEAARNLFDQLASYGLFVVPGGELESWLPELGAGGHGPGWLMSVFEAMGENPEQGDYVRPGEGDVWGFIERIGQWLESADRMGIPV